MTFERLQLSLEPLPAMRTPDESGRYEYGFHLRLADGPALYADDPLLRIYGALVLPVSGSLSVEALQSEYFAPGRRVRLEVEFDDDGDSVVGIWDTDGIRRAGRFPFKSRDAIVAGLDHGLELEGVVLREQVDAVDGHRQGIDILVHAPAFVDLDVPEALVAERPARPAPKRIVLLADGAGEVGFWDPSGATGPAAPADLPISSELADGLMKLRSKYRELAEGDEQDVSGMDAMTNSWTRDHLDQRTTILWRRARHELGRRFAVGFQGPGMTTPVWSPHELSDSDELDVSDAPF